MNPDLLLGVMTAFAGFLLKTSLAFALCLVWSWLDDSPGRRFLVWLSFLYGTAAYWLWLAQGILPKGPLVGNAGVSLVAPGTTAGGFAIPGSWAVPLGLALRVIGFAYLLISSYMLLMQVRKLRQLKWILGFTSQPTAEIEELFRPLAKKLHAGRSRLLILSGVTSPATFGWLRPTIVLPDICLQQDPSELEDILRHELHHVRRLDFVWNGLAVVCRALLFFHPAAWYSVRKMEFERELACDLAAVSDSPRERAKYAQCLIHFARLNTTQAGANWGIDFAASSDHLKKRVHSILAGSRKLSGWLICSRIACGMALLTGFVYVAPSLGVPLIYARRQVVSPETTEVQTAPTSVAAPSKSTRRSRSAATPAGAIQEATVPSPVQTAQGSVSAEPAANELAFSHSSAGPQLLHRGASVPGPKRQIVIPIEDGSGQSVKGGDQDRKQAAQQTATAVAGILKRLSDFDRH